MLTLNQKYDSITIKVDTPDGILFVTIVEDVSGKPIRLTAAIGKAGTSLRAWTETLTELINSLLEDDYTVNDIIAKLSGQVSDRHRDSDGISIRSGPDGIVVALMDYRSRKFRELRQQLIGDTDENDKRASWLGR